MQSCYSSLFTVVSPQNVVSVYVCQIWVKIGFYRNRKWNPAKMINQFFLLPGRWTICFRGPNNSSKNGARQAMGWRTGDWLFWCRSVGAEIWCCQMNMWNTWNQTRCFIFSLTRSVSKRVSKRINERFTVCQNQNPGLILVCYSGQSKFRVSLLHIICNHVSGSCQTWILVLCIG